MKCGSGLCAVANRCQRGFNGVAEWLAPWFDLVARLYIARVFFMSGLTKIRSWDGTIYLFTSEYQVPLLSPQVAAVLATTAELVLPLLLVIGLAGRFAALGLFILNAVAVAAYYPAMGELGLKDHILWGVLLAMLLVHGSGKIALDHLLARRCLIAGNGY